jgi:hypothetical protein
MLAGAALGVLAIVMRGKRDERDGESREPADWDEKRYGAWSENETPFDEYDHRDEEEYPPGIYRTAIKTVAACAAAIGVIVWCVTQNITGRMILTDGYTLLQGLLAAAAGVGFVLCVIKEKGSCKYEYKDYL